MASDNENKCLLTQVSIQSSSSDLKINLFDGGNKNNLKDKFEVVFLFSLFKRKLAINELIIFFRKQKLEIMSISNTGLI